MIAHRKDVRFWGYGALGCRIHITIVYLDQFRGTDWVEIWNGCKILRVIDLTASVWYMDRGRSRLLRKQDVIGSMWMSWMVASCPISQSALLSLMPSDQWPTYLLMFTWYVTCFVLSTPWVQMWSGCSPHLHQVVSPYIIMKLKLEKHLQRLAFSSGFVPF